MGGPLPTSSKAEKRVFELLAETELEGAVCLHSLRLHRHATKVSGEADFVIVSPRGILVLEVKGGRVRQKAAGWEYVDGQDRVHRSREGPFRQAETAMYALRDRAESALGMNALEALPFGFAVVTPDCALPANSIEWGPEIILDRHVFRGATELRRPLLRLLEYWRGRLDVPARVSATRDEVDAVVEFCRPTFDALPSLGVRVEDIQTQMLAATEEQYGVLDLFESFDRLIVHGGAGTGKTLLAAEIARRYANAGMTVLMTCYSRVLAQWLRSRLPANVTVVSHSALESSQPHDVLVCDEGQDLMTSEGLDRLDRVVEGGLDRGRWIVFLDPRNQAGVSGAFDVEVHALLLDRADAPRPVALRKNLRNTAHVLTETSLITGAALEPAVVTGGLPVRSHYVADTGEEASVLHSWLKDLEREEVPPASITILTPDPDPPLLREMSDAAQRRIRPLGGAGAAGWPLNDVSRATVGDFKGLENDVIILCGLWDLDVAEHGHLLYVGMTRARAELRVLWPETTRRALDDVKVLNTSVLGGRA